MQRTAIPQANRYFLKRLETLSLDELRQLQFSKTKETLERVYARSGFYRDLLDKAGVSPEDFKVLSDIARFPFIAKSDLLQDQRVHPPFGRTLCVLPGQTRRINLTSGTSGLGQEVHCHDETSIRAANAPTASHFAAIGLRKGDVSAVLHPLGTMTGGMLSYEGLRHFGAVPLPLAVFDTSQKVDMMRRFPLRHMLTTPAYLTRVTAVCMEHGLEPKTAFPHLKGITLSTEPFTIAWAERMEEIWGTVVHDIYGSSQLNLNFAITCKYGAVPDGEFGCYHLAEHFALVEVLNRETDRPAAVGEWGEPVVTTFSRNAMPLVRFRSNDRVRLLPPGSCDCGRTSGALWEVGTISRFDDMLKIKANNVWPQTIDEAVFSFDEIEEYNGRVYIKGDGHECAAISAEFKPHTVDEEARTAILRRLSKKIKTMTQVTMDVEEVPHGTLPRFEYKARRWSDERTKGMEQVKFLEK